jgi:heme/copper-type cytochrome/quinol oxidase subunit 4
MEIKIYVFFALSLVNIILFFKMNKKKDKTIKYRMCIFYFYLMFFVYGDMLLSLKSGDIPPCFTLFVFVTLMIIINAIFLTIKE